MSTIVTRIGKGSPLTTLEVDSNFTNLNTTKAELASPAFTGAPTAPTAAIGINTTQLATTAYVLANASTTLPIINGTAAIGTSTRFARADHVHAADTTRAPIASPTFTGVVTIPTGAVISGYAPLASPNFTGTVTGVNKAMVGLSLVDNTSDVSKPVSTLTATALATKAPTIAPTFTGTAVFSNDISIAGIMNSNGGIIELGNPASVMTPFIDWHSSGESNDYDVRLQAVGGGSGTGNGTLYLFGAVLNCSGEIIASGDITAFSDSRLKTEVKTLNHSLERVLSWRGVSFTRKADGSKSHGVIAQEVLKTAPDLVKFNDDSGYMSVNYQGMAGDFIEAFREVSEELIQLKAELKALKHG